MYQRLLLKELNIDAFYVVGMDMMVSATVANLPGLLLKAAKERKIELKKSRWRILMVAIAIERFYRPRTRITQIHPEITLESISEASDWVQNQ